MLSLGWSAWIWKQGPTAFWQGIALQAVIWGSVDALLALIAWSRTAPKINQRFHWIEANRQAKRLRRWLWINTALDVLYILVGIWLWQTHRQGNPFLAGNGLGVVIQGAFLLIFDSLHALGVPHEHPMPDLGIFADSIHDPFFFDGTNGGAILLVHGFPGSPAEVRRLGERLNQQGWTTQGLCLPGHGRDFPRLFQTRAPEWIEAVRKELRALAAHHSPVILLGYSLGGGLSTIVAAQEQPDGLVLIAPFWLRENPLVKWVTTVARPFLPVAFNPFRRMRIDAPQLRLAMGDLLPNLDLNAPEIQQALREIRVPLVFLEQFRFLGRAVQKSAPRLTMPVLVVQAVDDPVVRRRQTRHLITQIPGQVRYVEIPGGHDINRRSHPGHAQMEAAVMQFVEDVLQQQTKPA